MKRHELINWFIVRYRYRRYLEIGIDNPENCFNRILCQEKTGVDPNVGATNPPIHYRMTSDRFFAAYKGPGFDVAFIDGLHIDDQVLRDVNHVLHVLSPSGTIILHDCWPPAEELARSARAPRRPWYGTVWQAWATLRTSRSDLSMHTLADDCGLGIIRRGTQELYTGPWANFGEFQDHCHEILRIIGPGQLEGLYGGTGDK